MWAYDDEHRTQTLTGVQYLCDMCHRATYWRPDTFESHRYYKSVPRMREHGWDDVQIREQVHAERMKHLDRFVPRLSAKGDGLVGRLARINDWDDAGLQMYVLAKTLDWYRRNDYNDWIQVHVDHNDLAQHLGLYTVVADVKSRGQ
jgi:hypothetical protein